MRILKVVQAYYPFQEKGGPVVKVRALARGLARRGHEVTVLTVDFGLNEHPGPDVKPKRCKWGRRTEQEGVEAIYVPTWARYRALTVNRRVAAFCRDSLDRFDIVHIYGLYDLLGPVVGHFCRRQKIPYVIEPMGMFRPIVRSLRLKKLYHELLGKPLLGAACLLIATSEQEEKELTRGGIDPRRIVVRRNGIEYPDCLPKRGEFRRKWGIQENAKIVLFLGRMVSKKSPDLLLEAFARWRSKGGTGGTAVLILAGPEERDGFVPHLKKMAEHLQLGQSVRFVGPLYDDEKWEAYRDADVFVLASQNENFGNTAAESAACGTPVIVTDRCGIAPFVGQAGLVVSYDLSEVEAALAQLLESSSLWQRCQAGCAQMALALSWDAPLSQNEQLYSQCIARHPGGRDRQG